MVGDGSPTALQGSTMSLIQGVVTVRLKVRIRAGAAKAHICFISPDRRCRNPFSSLSQAYRLRGYSVHQSSGGQEDIHHLDATQDVNALI